MASKLAKHKKDMLEAIRAKGLFVQIEDGSAGVLALEGLWFFDSADGYRLYAAPFEKGEDTLTVALVKNGRMVGSSEPEVIEFPRQDSVEEDAQHYIDFTRGFIRGRIRHAASWTGPRAVTYGGWLLELTGRPPAQEWRASRLAKNGEPEELLSTFFSSAEEAQRYIKKTFGKYPLIKLSESQWETTKSYAGLDFAILREEDSEGEWTVVCFDSKIKNPDDAELGVKSASSKAGVDEVIDSFIETFGFGTGRD